jgi:hypothetical protein
MRESFALFVESTWQWVPLGLAAPIRTHIIRSELEASARLMGLAINPAIFGDIRVMEEEALRYWSKRR